MATNQPQYAPQPQPAPQQQPLPPQQQPLPPQQQAPAGPPPVAPQQQGYVPPNQAPQVINAGGKLYQAVSRPARPNNSWIRKTAGERRLDQESARDLARRVFSKYDANHSGFMNSMEASQMITDLYASINEHHPTSQQDGLDLLYANDVNHDGNISVQDFEEIFVKFLSTNDDTGYSLTNPYVSSTVARTTPGKLTAQQLNPTPAPAPAPAVVRQAPATYAQPARTTYAQPAPAQYPPAARRY